MLTLRDLLVQEKPLCLDGSQVQRVSTACLQVLVAACQSARAHQVPYVLDAPSTALSAAMQDLGLSPVMLGAAADATPDMALGALPA